MAPASPNSGPAVSVSALADQLLDVIAAEDPLNDFLQGYPGFGHLLGNVSAAAEAGLRERALAIAATARGIEPAESDRVTHALVLQQATALVDRIDAKLIEHTVADFMIAPLTRLLGTLPAVHPAGAQHEADYLARLAAVPEFLAGAVTRHLAGVAAGRLPVASRVASAIDQLDSYLANPADDPLLRPPLNAANAAERERLLAEVVRPALASYREVLNTELAPHGRPDDRAGLCWLPDGAAAYAAMVRHHTTTDLSPEAIHQTGLDLMDELAREYEEIGSRVFGLHTVAQVQHRMRTDPALRWDSAEELLGAARAAIDRAELAAPDWFGRLPTLRCGLESTPPEKAPTSSIAYYVPGAPDGSRPGTYFANTYKATERHRYLAEATAFHEAVPGHHFQITLAQELTGLPRLRQVAWINAYLEGWGLYAEQLAEEMGLYSGDIARLGRLANDSIRVARLVVDTGLHAFGWSRQRVVDYLRANTVMAEVELQSETDRYIEWPGQALSYRIGQLEFQRLRARAEQELGAAFDIRAFHDLVLGGGPLPMKVLDTVVTQWTTTIQRAPGAARPSSPAAPSTPV